MTSPRTTFRHLLTLVISHSMGAAYAKGLIKGLYYYASRTGKNVRGLIKYEIDLAPYQPGLQKPHPDVPTYVIQHRYDYVARTEKMKGAEDQLVTRKQIPEKDQMAWYKLKLNCKVGLREHNIKSFESDLEFIKTILSNSHKKH